MTGPPRHPSMKPVIRSTELRRLLRSRCARPGPDRSENAAAAFPSDHLRDTIRCGGTMAPSSSSSSRPARPPGRCAALGMSTGAEHCRWSLEALGAAVDDPHALPGAPWRVSGHSTSHSDSSSSTVDISVRFCARAGILHWGGIGLEAR
ncbi:hypothetical protein VPH35_060736 [Triticum aestivum]